MRKVIPSAGRGRTGVIFGPAAQISQQEDFDAKRRSLAAEIVKLKNAGVPEREN